MEFRASTPNLNSDGGATVRGKVLSYQTPKRTRGSSSDIGSRTLPIHQVQQMAPRNSKLSGSVEMNIQGRSAVGPRNSLGILNAGRSDIYGVGYRFLENDGRENSVSATSVLPRHDLIPLSEEIPQDGIIFSRVRNHSDMMVVFRTPEERARNPERLNLDRRLLEACPVLEQEQRLRLLNFQNNNIRVIQNLENLPNLIFLDLYNNKLTSLDGPLSCIAGLRVLMAGKNRISGITNLFNLRKLDVLDLHSNEIKDIEGMNCLGDLRVLNLAGNRISIVKNLSSLQSLTELNLRRNSISKILELDKIQSLQRVFLSHNLITTNEDMNCLFSSKYLIELSLDGNPISETDVTGYRRSIVLGMPGLRHLDLKRITDEERAVAQKEAALILQEESKSGFSNRRGSPALSSGNSTTPKTGNQGTVSAGAGTIVKEYVGGNNSTNVTAFPLLIPDPEESRLSSGNQDSHMNPTPALSLPSPFNPTGIARQLSSERTPARARANTSGNAIPTKSMFELEVTGPNEKSLLLVGETWDWMQSKRMLATVTEACLEHMKKDVILGKFGANISWLPALKSLHLAHNDLHSYEDLYRIGSLFVTLDNLGLRDNPICSQPLFRQVVIASFSGLKFLNQEVVTQGDRDRAILMLQPIFRMHNFIGNAKALTSQVNSAVPPIPTTKGRFLNSARGIRGFGGVSSKAVSFEEKAVEDAYIEIRKSVDRNRAVRDNFDEVFQKVVKKIILDTIISLNELDIDR